MTIQEKISAYENEFNPLWVKCQSLSSEYQRITCSNPTTSEERNTRFNEFSRISKNMMDVNREMETLHDKYFPKGIDN
jgi:hypothetical protein